MHKWLAIVSLVILVSCGAWPQVPGNGGQQEKKAQNQQKTTDSPKPVVVIESQHGAGNQEKASKESSGYPWKELLAPANIPNWFLVVVGTVTGWFVYKTLRAIKKQADIMEMGAKDARESSADATRIALATAKAAQKSADAANAQIQMMRDKERARIQVTPVDFDTVRIGENDNNHMVIEFLNLGPTHAFNVRAEGDGRFTVKGFDSQELEMTDLVLPAVLRPNISETSWVPLWFDGKAGDEVRDMQAKTVLEMMGSIEYDDVFGERHQTAFHYRMFVYGWERSKADKNTAKMKRMGGWSKTGPPKDNHAS